MKWKLLYYERANGKWPVYDFINGLPQKASAKVYNTLELLQEFGVQLGAPYVKKVTGTGLWELRIVGSDSIRIFYIAIQKQTFLLLHGFKKKKQKTPKKEIKTALTNLSDYRLHNK
jgi:phage-related protein